MIYDKNNNNNNSIVRRNVIRNGIFHRISLLHVRVLCQCVRDQIHFQDKNWKKPNEKLRKTKNNCEFYRKKGKISVKRNELKRKTEKKCLYLLFYLIWFNLISFWLIIGKFSTFYLKFVQRISINLKSDSEKIKNGIKSTNICWIDLEKTLKQKASERKKEERRVSVSECVTVCEWVIWNSVKQKKRGEKEK